MFSVRSIIVSAAAVATLALTAGPALAQTQPIGPPEKDGTVSNAVVVKATGQSAFAYPDYVFGWVRVNETSHPKFDTIGGTFLSGDPEQGGVPIARPDLAGQTGTNGWYSDFAAGVGPHGGQTNGTITYTVNADGTGYSGLATYPS